VVLSISPSPELLLGRFGLGGFRSGQREAVAAVLAGRDCVVVMPTGGGKSLCYQLPALAGRGLVVVVSPLIALMADQLSALLNAGVHATMIASGMPPEYNDKALRDLGSGRAQLVLVSPERFASHAFRRVLMKRRIALFVVDEAHCVAEWGHDFRPDYLRLSGVIKSLGRPPVMAATATATPPVTREIALRLGLRNWLQINCGYERPNLTLDVVTVQGEGMFERKRELLLRALSDGPSLPAVVYCGTRKDTERVSQVVGELGVEVVGYHAGKSAQDRWASQQAFMAGKAQVVVATNAFGMGVNKADVRTVVHWAVPKSVEAYYQEAGRAGRDGKPAKALLLAARTDLARLIRFNDRRDIEVPDVEHYIERLTERARGGVVDSEALEEEDRILMSVAEHAGALFVGSSPQGRLRLTLTGRLDACAADHAIKAAQERCWQSYHAIEQFISSDDCRRRQILDFFGDTQPPKPTVRCCDVCESPWDALAVPSFDARELKRLKQWRAERARGRPAYMVATDAALKEMLQRHPKNAQGLLRIPGIGKVFCEQHGPSLLEVLHGLPSARSRTQARESDPAA
jgi:RecQ family ATP-dependent DNA helicase